MFSAYGLLLGQPSLCPTPHRPSWYLHLLRDEAAVLRWVTMVEIMVGGGGGGAGRGGKQNTRVLGGIAPQIMLALTAWHPYAPVGHSPICRLGLQRARRQ